MTEKEKLSEDDENRILPGCQFPTLALLSGIIDIPIGQGSAQKWQVGA